MIAELLSRFGEALRATLDNQVVGGGLVLMLAGALMALLRNVPFKMLALLNRQLTVSVDVLSNDALFGWLAMWLDAHPYSRTARRITASSSNDQGGGVPAPSSDKKPDAPRVLFTPAPGNHVLWVNGRPVWLTRERKEPTGGRDGWNFREETFTLRMFGRDPAAARAILEQARDFAYRDERTVGVHVCRWGEWYRIHETPPRPLESVVLPAGVMDELLEDLRAFLGSSTWYQERGIPWRRGYLFEGVPGSGKTSAIAAVAGNLGLDLYVLNLADRSLDDERLVANLLRISPRSAVLLEDVDCVVNGREMQAEGGATFSGLLNALDGVASTPGVVTFLTTNHPDRLDPALLRHGRVDYRVTFHPATAEQASRYFTWFYRGARGDHPTSDPEVFGRLASGLSMAAIQGLLIDHRDDSAGAIRALQVRRPAVA